MTEQSETQRRLRQMLPALIIDLVVPLAVYGALQLAGMSVIWSLAGGSVVPIVRVIVTAVHERRVNGLALFVLCALLVGLALALITGDARLAIARDAVIGLALGVIFIGSLATRRPLMFYATRSFGGGRLGEQWDRLPALRRDLRYMTLAIGVLCLVDAAARVVLAYTLPIRTAGLIVHFLPIVLIVVIMAMGRPWGARIRGYVHETESAADGNGPR